MNFVMSLLEVAGVLALMVCVLVLTPMAIFRRTRGVAGAGFYYSSYVFGALLFVYSCVVAYFFWGVTGIVIGLVLAGVGVFPVALLAALLHTQWSNVLELVVLGVLVISARTFGLWLRVDRAEQVEQEQAEKWAA